MYVLWASKTALTAALEPAWKTPPGRGRISVVSIVPSLALLLNFKVVSLGSYAGRLESSHQVQAPLGRSLRLVVIPPLVLADMSSLLFGQGILRASLRVIARLLGADVSDFSLKVSESLLGADVSGFSLKLARSLLLSDPSSESRS